MGAYTTASYQNVALPDLKGRQLVFDDLVPAYKDCWDYRTNNGERIRSGFSDEALAQIAECERTADRWSVLENGILIAVCVPIIALVLGWAFVWAFRGFLPAKST